MGCAGLGGEAIGLWILGGGGIGFGLGESIADAFEAIDDGFGDDGEKLFEFPAEHDDLSDEAAAGECERFAGHDEDGFDTSDGAVGECELELVADVACVAESAEDDGGADGFDEIHGEAGVTSNFDVVKIACNVADHVDAFVEREELAFIRIDADRDNQAIIEFCTSSDEIEVSSGDGIELSRKYRQSV